MATRVQIEARVLAAVDAVAAGLRVEDALIELKAEWPEPKKAARRIAGHANAARGEDILWIIGLDETTGLRSVDLTELADWWAQVQSQFDGLPPALTDLVVCTSGGSVQALHFDTSLGPFVTKNPAYGQAASGPVEREVPWRDGTGVRSARREDLVRLLVPMQSLPDVEVLSASASVALNPARDPKYHPNETGLYAAPHLSWRVWIELFVTPATDCRVVLPVHRTVVTLQGSGPDDAALGLTDVIFRAPGWHSSSGFHYDTNSVEVTTSEALVHLPGRLFIEARLDEPDRQIAPQAPAVVSLSLRPAGTEHCLLQQITLLEVAPEHGSAAAWKFGTSPASI